jgi:ligand-binding SRPBCC domain-containing protein
MADFVITTQLSCPPDAAFDASLDIDLHLRSMAASGERAVGGVTRGKIGLGESVTWSARHFGVWWRMTSTISAYERPVRFVDEQVRGPFRSWRHEHRFEDRAGGTRMTDVVEFTAPLGPLGAVVAGTVLRAYLRRLIARRNAELKAATEG